jgi:replicative DNA helicase
MLKTLKRKKNQSQSFSLKKIKQTKENRELLIEKYLLSYLFQGENPFLIAEKVFKILEEKDFSQPSFQKILTIFFQEKKEKEKFVLNDFIKKLTPELREVFDEIYLFSSVDQMIEDESIEKIASEIKKNSLKRQIKKILEKEENEENKLKLVKLSESLKEVEKILIS